MSKWFLLTNYFGRLISSKPFYASLEATFKYYLRRNFFRKDSCLFLYEDKIVPLSVFLFISSAFIIKRPKEKYFDFDWQTYFSVFRSEHMKGFLLCSIRYLLDSGRILPEHESNIFSILSSDLKKSFSEQYLESTAIRTRNGLRKIDENINLLDYVSLLDLVLKISFIYREEIKNDSSKILDLVDYTTKWKAAMVELFKHRAEYIMFSFLINLSK